MRNTKFRQMKWLFPAVLMLQLFVASCGQTREITEFQLWSGNVSLPPQYQYEQVIRGKINPSDRRVTINFSERKGDDKTVKSLELTGEDYENCVLLVKNTSLIKMGFMAGGSAFDVTLIDSKGKNKMGTPFNKQDWIDFADSIKQKIYGQ